MKTRREFLRDSAGVSAGLFVPGIHCARAFTGAGTNPAVKRPNIILMLADDMGFSDIGCYGSEIETPNLDKLAAGGLRFTQFYNNPRCCPSRASLMTGLYPHQVGFGMMADDYGKYPFPAYKGDLSDRCVTIAEALRLGGYHTAMCGKWHLTPPQMESKHNWPCQRGYERFFGTILGAGSHFDPATLCRDNTPIRAHGDFYYADAIAENAVRYIDEFSGQQEPFFLYTAFTTPHWPLQAPAETMAKYKDRYRAGWDALRRERRRRMIDLGIVENRWEISPRDSRVPAWELAPYKDWEMHRMAVYAAMIDRMDQNIGKIVAKLEERGILNDTLIFFMSDNGGNYEEISNPWPRYDMATPHETSDGRIVRAGNDPSILPGPDDTFQSYGIPWANVSNTPFRYYKHYAHEGGISTPLIAHWPAGIRQAGALTNQIGHETDIMATSIDVAQVKYPATYRGREIIPLEGESLAPIFRSGGRQRGPIFWEHEGNSAVHLGKWKLVSAFPDTWELYDMEADRTEMHNLADENPDRMKRMIAMYDQWAKKVGVVPWPLPGRVPQAPGLPPRYNPYLDRDKTLSD